MLAGYTSELASAVTPATAAHFGAAQEGDPGEMVISTLLPDMRSGDEEDAKIIIELCDAAMNLWHFDLVKILAVEGTVIGGFGLPGSQDLSCAHFYEADFTRDIQGHDIKDLGSIALENVREMAGDTDRTFTQVRIPAPGTLEIVMAWEGNSARGAEAAIGYCNAMIEYGAYQSVTVIEESGAFSAFNDPITGVCSSET